MTDLSGAKWWHENQSNYPNSRRLRDLDGNRTDFQECARRFIKALETNKPNIDISIGSTLRHPIRAYLMHYCWDIAEGRIEPEKVPGMKGVNIRWDHGDREASVNGAREMVKLFNIAYRPALTSNHTRGTAIDMTITWRGEIAVPLPDGTNRKIGGPCNGAENRDLHEVGALYGVHKLVKDKPHWSVNGK